MAAIGATALLAATVPTLLAYNVAPSSTFLNQALAFGLWGWFVMACAWGHGAALRACGAAAPLLAALALLIGATIWSWGPGVLPGSLAASLALSLLAAAVLAVSGASMTAGGAAVPAFVAFSAGWVVAALGGVAVALVQVFAPSWADGDWIARSSIVGRAVGNLRQPNHLSSVLLWGSVGLIALAELRVLSHRVATIGMAALLFALVLSASRTGLVSVLLLALWGLADWRLARKTRLLLLATPLLYAAGWLAMTAWGRISAHAFAGEARLAETDISGSRFGIWSDTLALIRMHPWAGVGMGEFNFAWSLTELPRRPIAFFDHAHNLPLHLAAELGLPLAGAVMGLLLLGLGRGALAVPRIDGERSVLLRSALAFVVMIGLHSLLEYPLWYAYFLLPTAWAFGFLLALVPVARPAPNRLGSPALLLAGAALVVGAGLSVIDYRRVAVIFAAPEGAPPLAERIAQGQRSVLFAHHADYAAATTDLPQADALAPFERATHYLLDTRLMVAWAEALERSGRADEARHVAARLREFRNPASDEFFAACPASTALPAASAFGAAAHCALPLHEHHWREFARP